MLIIKRKLNFKQKYKLNNNEIEKIDNYIDEWHNSNSKLELYEYLGLTEEEYQKYVTNPNNLKNILDR